MKGKFCQYKIFPDDIQTDPPPKNFFKVIEIVPECVHDPGSSVLLRYTSERYSFR